LSDESLPETLLYAALDRFGRCDICFNNGALFEAGIIETVDIERLSSMVRVNVEGSFRVAYVFMKHFVSEGSGHLVNVSSVLGSSVRPTPYAATQRAIEALSDALAAELEDTEVLVSCIQPGLVKTGMHHRWEIAQEGATGYPLEAEDFARMVLFILEQPGMQEKEVEAAGGEMSAGGELAEGGHSADATVDVEEPGWQSEEEEAASDASKEGFVQDEI
jgi:NADP-dependent 3-hydroxy acid dehydrogenase YdfG